ncbi:hypothetical protein BOTBODRAFT_28563 [Botryobasidium botryosum FD-172 SS1]|uniref:DASH complex subunit DAM1 n=1 Tax=Botryobasidium botryosum (strain FD-172 SS1) TaxID=930990 RepID=A0A067MTI9_BOTB1|nr:hypothetical protein BOTBODRAFT_28563 [Botryobasidium botryosum FD-172 SS1]
MPPAPPRTPLRRVSHGSLTALARSANQAPGVTGLEFLEPAMVELADEAATLHSNIERLNALSDALDTFNESFASYLYAMRMNAFCVEWHQAPGNESFVKAARDAERAAEAAKAALAATPQPSYEATFTQSESQQQDQTYMSANVGGSGAADMTYATVSARDDDIQPAQRGAAPQKGKGKAPAKKGLTAKEKKERGLKIARVIDALPLEFRGSDPDLRYSLETIIAGLMESPGGKRLLEFVKPPILPQARVNKCLIALVNRKVARKVSKGGTMVYEWVGLPS